jgi:hypothetical protein
VNIFRQIVAFFAKSLQIVAFFAKSLRFSPNFAKSLRFSPKRCTFVAFFAKFRQIVAFFAKTLHFCAFLRFFALFWGTFLANYFETFIDPLLYISKGYSYLQNVARTGGNQPIHFAQKLQKVQKSSTKFPKKAQKCNEKAQKCNGLAKNATIWRNSATKATKVQRFGEKRNDSAKFGDKRNDSAKFGAKSNDLAKTATIWRNGDTRRKVQSFTIFGKRSSSFRKIHDLRQLTIFGKRSSSFRKIHDLRQLTIFGKSFKSSTCYVCQPKIADSADSSLPILRIG